MLAAATIFTASTKISGGGDAARCAWGSVVRVPRREVDSLSARVGGGGAPFGTGGMLMRSAPSEQRAAFCGAVG